MSAKRANIDQILEDVKATDFDDMAEYTLALDAKLTEEGYTREEKIVAVKSLIEKQMGRVRDEKGDETLAEIQRAKALFNLFTEKFTSTEPMEVIGSLEISQDVFLMATELITESMFMHQQFKDLPPKEAIRLAVSIALGTGAEWKEYLHA